MRPYISLGNAWEVALADLKDEIESRERMLPNWKKSTDGSYELNQYELKEMQKIYAERKKKSEERMIKSFTTDKGREMMKKALLKAKEKKESLKASLKPFVWEAIRKHMGKWNLAS